MKLWINTSNTKYKLWQNIYIRLQISEHASFVINMIQSKPKFER